MRKAEAERINQEKKKKEKELEKQRLNQIFGSQS